MSHCISQLYVILYGGFIHSLCLDWSLEHGW